MLVHLFRLVPHRASELGDVEIAGTRRVEVVVADVLAFGLDHGQIMADAQVKLFAGHGFFPVVRALQGAYTWISLAWAAEWGAAESVF